MTTMNVLAAAIEEVHRRFEQDKQTLFVPPGDAARVQAVIEARAAAGLIEVVASPYCPDGQILIASTSATPRPIHGA